MAKNISLLGADYPDVPAVVLPKTGGGSARFVDEDDILIPTYYDISAGNNVTIYRQKACKLGNLVFISAYARITATIAANERLFTIPWAPASAIDIPIIYVNGNKTGGLYCGGGAYQVVKNLGDLVNGDEIMFNCWYST